MRALLKLRCCLPLRPRRLETGDPGSQLHCWCKLAAHNKVFYWAVHAELLPGLRQTLTLFYWCVHFVSIVHTLVSPAVQLAVQHGDEQALSLAVQQQSAALLGMHSDAELQQALPQVSKSPRCERKKKASVWAHSEHHFAQDREL